MSWAPFISTKELLQTTKLVAVRSAVTRTSLIFDDHFVCNGQGWLSFDKKKTHTRTIWLVLTYWALTIDGFARGKLKVALQLVIVNGMKGKWNKYCGETNTLAADFAVVIRPCLVYLPTLSSMIIWALILLKSKTRLDNM